MRMAEDSNFVMATWPCGLRPHFLHWSKLGQVEGSNPDGGICSFFLRFFSFILFLPFGLFPFILTVDPLKLHEIFAITYF